MIRCAVCGSEAVTRRKTDDPLRIEVLACPDPDCYNGSFGKTAMVKVRVPHAVRDVEVTIDIEKLRREENE